LAGEGGVESHGDVIEIVVERAFVGGCASVSR
jgi:hypothetical protein